MQQVTRVVDNVLTEVTLKKMSNSISIVPAVPKRYLATSMAARPAPISKDEKFSSAHAVGSSVVPHTKGIENHAKAPVRNRPLLW